ncbi:MAG: MlaD family protein [Saprospiraceae bacterium]|nr:MlaD family protein [Saprospiraceae bacterium]
MKKEIKIGLLGIAALLILIFGYKYLKGQNLFNQSKTYYVKYMDVNMLDVSNPVLVNGFQVGSVINVQIDEEDANLIKVTIDVRSEIKLPEETVAVLISTGVLGDKAIDLEFDRLCTDDCLEDGSTLEGRTKGFLGSMMGTPEDMDAYISKVKEGVTGDSSVNKSLTELQLTIRNLNNITSHLDDILENSSNAISQSLNNVNDLTTELNNNRNTITASLDNLEAFTQQLKNSEVDQLIESSNKTINSADEVFTSMKTTLEETNESVKSLKSILVSIEDGQGTLGKMVKDETLYNRLDRVSQNLDYLIQDIRLNPKRYINVSVFGKKQKEYEVPENDPAFNKSSE